jgi:hypothetical protein
LEFNRIINRRHLISRELPKIIERLVFDRKNYIIVVYGACMYLTPISINDAKLLIKEITAAISKMSEDCFSVVQMVITIINTKRHFFLFLIT